MRRIQSAGAGAGADVARRAVVTSRTKNRRGHARGVAKEAGGAGSFNALAIRAAKKTLGANFARARAVCPRLRAVGPSWARCGGGHPRCVAKGAGGARHREHGCTAEVGAEAAEGAQRAHRLQRRTGGQESGGADECARRAVATDAAVDGVDVAVLGPDIHGAVRAKRGG